MTVSFLTISNNYPLILASASPRRNRLLTQIGLPFRSVTSKVTEEDQIGDPTVTSRSLAEQKACQVYSSNDAFWVLGADTVVVIGNNILGKPGNKEEARQMLELLSGKEHRVVTGFCILNPSGKVALSEAVTTLVQIKNLSKQEIDLYIATGEPYGKAGSYAIQEIGSFMVEGITGSYTNVVGLPLCALIKALISLGALERFPLPCNL
jgi:septum formation protein